MSLFSKVQIQRAVTSIALEVAAQHKFALAGSGAIREHGLITRPTDDIDLFTVASAHNHFDLAAEQIVTRLREAGVEVEVELQADSYARFSVTAEGEDVLIELGVDYRSREPVTFELGPVLAIEDAVANKLSALYSRAYPRDYLDVDSIRRNGPFSDAQLLTLAEGVEPNFDRLMFAHQLSLIANTQPNEVAVYGLNADDLQAVKQRCIQWARTIKTDAGLDPDKGYNPFLPLIDPTQPGGASETEPGPGVN